MTSHSLKSAIYFIQYTITVYHMIIIVAKHTLTSWVYFAPIMPAFCSLPFASLIILKILLAKLARPYTCELSYTWTSDIISGINWGIIGKEKRIARKNN